jgi:type IV pilus assembly protein PilM
VRFFRAPKKKKHEGLVGLDIGSSSVKVVELKQCQEGYELVNLALDPLGQDVIVDGSIMDAPSVSAVIEKIFQENKIEHDHVAVSVSGHAVIVKRITVAASDQRELEEAIQREAAQHIRFDLADLSLSYHVLGPEPTGQGLDILLLAVKREKLESHTGVLAQAGKVPMVVDIDAFALQNAFEVAYEPPPSQTVALLNIGASLMNINITRDGVPLFTRDVSVGGNQYTDILQKELDLSFEDAEKLKQGKTLAHVPAEAEAPHLRSVTELVLLEIQKTFDFFRQTRPADHIDAIYLAGGSARVQGLAPLLAAEFNLPVEVLNPFRKIRVDPSAFDPRYVEENASRMTIAVGLALRSFDAA